MNYIIPKGTQCCIKQTKTKWTPHTTCKRLRFADYDYYLFGYGPVFRYNGFDILISKELPDKRKHIDRYPVVYLPRTKFPYTPRKNKFMRYVESPHLVRALTRSDISEEVRRAVEHELYIRDVVRPLQKTNNNRLLATKTSKRRVCHNPIVKDKTMRKKRKSLVGVSQFNESGEHQSETNCVHYIIPRRR